MIEKAKNKDIQPSEEPIEEYHFAGAGEYIPLTVRARSREEAEKIWLQERVKVEPGQIIN